MQTLNPSAVVPEFCCFHQHFRDAGAVVLDHILPGGKVKGWCCLNPRMASATPLVQMLGYFRRLLGQQAAISPPPTAPTPTELLLLRS